MPFCPQCGEEYRAGIETCADCNLPLAAEPASGEGDLEQALLVATTTPELAVSILETCRELELPCLPAGDPPRGILLPLALVQQVLGRLQEARPDLTLESSKDPRTPPLLREVDPEVDLELTECTQLERSPADLQGDGEALDELVDAVLRGTPSLAHAALDRLVQVGPQGVERVGAMVGDLCRQGETLTLELVIQVFKEHGAQGLEPYLAPLLDEKDPEVLLLVLRAIWQLRLQGLGRQVCPLLLHRDERIQEEVDEILIAFTGRDLGFSPDLSLEERQRMMAERLADLGG